MREQDFRDQEPPAIPSPDQPSTKADSGDSFRETVSPVTLDATTPLRRLAPINLDGILWAAVLIWAGVVFVANSLGLLDFLGLRGFALSWDAPFRPLVWTLLFLGIAVLVTLNIGIRLIVPVYRRNVLGYVVLTCVCVALGFGRLGLMWPLILIALGVALILRRRR